MTSKILTRATVHLKDQMKQHLLKMVASERSNLNRVSFEILIFIAKSGTDGVTSKYSPSIAGGTQNNLNGLPMKLAEMRGENEVDSD
jgi:hypothetical protein